MNDLLQLIDFEAESLPDLTKCMNAWMQGIHEEGWEIQDSHIYEPRSYTDKWKAVIHYAREPIKEDEP